MVGDHYYNARRYDEALEQYRKTIELDPNFPTSRENLGLTYIQKGMYKEAIAEFQKQRDLTGDNLRYLILTAQVDAKSGKKQEVHQRLNQIQELSKKQYVSSTDIAAIYALLSEKEQAFQWLEKAYQEQSIQLEYLKVERNYDNLRDDPRFADIIRRVGLPQ